ncbi:hypothetical protein S83_043239, partial [Arachis hypogaea]
TSSLLYCEASRFLMRQSIDPLQASFKLQRQLDTYFLLAHMCSVKLKEWTLVLLTLLRSSKFSFCKGSHLEMCFLTYSDMMFGCEKHAAPQC